MPPLNFDNPKRSKIWYVVHGAINHCLAAAKCESTVIDFGYFLNLFWMFCEKHKTLGFASSIIAFLCPVNCIVDSPPSNICIIMWVLFTGCISNVLFKVIFGYW